MRILVSGSHGFVGKAVVSFLKENGYEVVSLKRSKTLIKSNSEIYWDPSKRALIPSDFEGFHAVIHLAGESVASGLWTQKKKESIMFSRKNDTLLLSETLKNLASPPKIFICASAIGYYGDRKFELLNEKSTQGKGFLATVCEKWEEATLPAKDKGIRVINARFGHVLDSSGGILKRILPIYKWGLGAVFGKKEQVISWISLRDLTGAILHCLQKEEISGPVNFTAPYPVSQVEFVSTIARKLNRPNFLHIPGFILKFCLGQMGEELFLFSTLAYPEVLMTTGYTFSCPTLNQLKL